MPVSRAFSTYPSGSPARKPSLQVLFTELPQRETPHLQSPIQPSLKVPGRRALLQVPQTGPLWKEMPVSRAFSIYPLGSPRREPPLQVPLKELPEGEILHSQSPPSVNFQSYQQKDPPTQVPQWGPTERDTRLIHLSKSPVNEPPSRFPSGVHRERCPAPESSST